LPATVYPTSLSFEEQVTFQIDGLHSGLWPGCSAGADTLHVMNSL